MFMMYTYTCTHHPILDPQMKILPTPLLTCREYNRDLACSIPSVSLHPTCLPCCRTRADPAACSHNDNKLLKTQLHNRVKLTDVFCGIPIEYRSTRAKGKFHSQHQNVLPRTSFCPMCSSTALMKSVSSPAVGRSPLPPCRDWGLEKPLIANRTYLGQILGVSLLDSSHVFSGFPLIIYF